VIAGETREVVFPGFGQLRDSGDAPGGEQVHDAAGAGFGRSEVKREFTAIGKVPVAITALHRYDNLASAAKTVEEGERGQGARQGEDWRHVAM
jgi:hypothetical protein